MTNTSNTTLTDIPSSISIKISSRAYFSITHLSSACLFAKNAGEIERTNTLDTAIANGLLRDHRAYVSSAIILATAFLEATFNELFSDCAEHADSRFQALPAAHDMGIIWKHGVPRTARYSILEKCNKALSMNGKAEFKDNKQPAKEMVLLTKLRNALIHFEPEHIVTFASGPRSQSDVHKFEDIFRNKFSLNQLTGAGNAFYPDKLLGHGCSVWAIQTAITFTDAVFQSLGVEPLYEHCRSLVTTI